MRSVFMREKKADIENLTLGEEKPQTYELSPETAIEHINIFIQKDKYEQAAEAFLQNIGELPDDFTISSFNSLIGEFDKISEEKEVHILLKFSKAHQMYSYESIFIPKLEQYLRSNDRTVKREAYMFCYNNYVDYDHMQQKPAMNQLTDTQMLEDIIETNYIEIQSLIIEIQALKVMNYCANFEVGKQIIMSFIHFPLLVINLNDLLTEVLDKDDDASFFITCKEAVDELLTENFLLVQDANFADVPTFQSFMELLNGYFKKRAMVNAAMVSELFTCVILKKNVDFELIFFKNCEKFFEQIPCIQLIKNISIEQVNEMICLLANERLQEVILDTFLKIQTSYEPQIQWFEMVCKCDIKNENMAYAMSLILEDFLEMDERYWPELRPFWDRLLPEMSRYESEKEFIEQIIQGFMSRNI